jgi:hypothetical protein
MYMKYCPRCKENKTLDDFYKKHDRRASSYCKPCQLAYVREHYRRTAGAYNTRRYILHAKYRKRNRTLVLEHLSTHPCIDCAEADLIVLDFDHVTDTKCCSISQMIMECGSYRTQPWLYQKAGSEELLPAKR